MRRRRCARRSGSIRSPASRLRPMKRPSSMMGGDAQKWAPSTRETADHSLPYTIAAMLEDGRITAATYHDARMKAPHTKALMDKISISKSAEMTRRLSGRLAVRITVRDKEGGEQTHLQEFPKGHTAQSPDRCGGRQEVPQRVRSLRQWRNRTARAGHDSGPPTSSPTPASSPSAVRGRKVSREHRSGGF